MLSEHCLSWLLSDSFNSINFFAGENDLHYTTSEGFISDVSVYPCIHSGTCSALGSTSNLSSLRCVTCSPTVLHHVFEGGGVWKSLPEDPDPDQLWCIDPRLTVKSGAVRDPPSHAVLESDLYDENGELVGKLLPDNFRLPGLRISVDIPGLSSKTFVPSLIIRQKSLNNRI